MKKILSHQPDKDENNKKSFIYNKDIILPNLTLISKLG